jgi:hypothetical protein
LVPQPLWLQFTAAGKERDVYAEGWVIPETAAIVGLFSLAWFLAGLLIGSYRRRSADAGARQPRQKSRDRAPQGQKTAKGDRVEIYVGNLSYEMSEKEVAALFEAFGQVMSARLIENKFSGKSKGFGFIEMPNRDHAMAAIRALNGKELKGRKLIVNEARSRARD